MKHAIHTTLALLVFSIACGGSPKETATAPDTTTPHAGDTSGSGGPVADDNSANMLSPDKMDEAERDLGRKSMIMSQCLAAAMEAGQVKRGAHGKVAVEIVVQDGKASSVKVIKSDFDAAPAVNDCVVKHVQEIEFPRMIKPYETSHTYPMEAN